jgi:polar amino acid transport system substrate-binding protein
MDSHSWMRARHRLLPAMLMTIASTSCLARPTLTLVSDPWPQYLDADGGYLLKLSKKIFAPQGYFVSYENVPFSRALLLVKSTGNYIAPALYDDARPGIIYAKVPTAMDVTAVIINTRSFKWNAAAPSLSRKKIAWIRGFDYQYILKKTDLGLNIPQFEVNNRETGLAILKQGRVDAYMDNDMALEASAQEHGLLAPQFEIHEVFRKGLYFGFADTPQGRNLKALFDREVARMLADGSLNKLYRASVKNGPKLEDRTPPQAGRRGK